MALRTGSKLLDGCVLKLLINKDSYAYILIQNLPKPIFVSESTIYQTLQRLSKKNLLTTYNRQFQGRKRHYYHITVEGKRYLQNIQSEWKDIKIKVDSILDDS